MSVDLIFRIAGVGILTAVLHTVLKQVGREELSHLVTLAGVALVLMWVVQLLAQLFDQVRMVFQLY